MSNENQPPEGVPTGAEEHYAQINQNVSEDRRAALEISRYTSWRMSKHEAARLAFQLVLIVALFAPDWEALRTMLYVMGVFLGVTLIAHISRKYALFPYVDMRWLYNKAKKEPLPAAIVFASVSAIIVVCIDTAAKFFVRG